MAMQDLSVPAGYCLFDTAIGPCGLAWSEHGVTHLQLAQASRSKTEHRLRSRAGHRGPGTSAPAFEQVITQIRRYLGGHNVDFRTVSLDLRQVDPFHRQVYDAARNIGWGETATYGELARLAGASDAAREVGRAMSRNPVPIIIPCHRIIAKGNRFGGFSAFGGVDTKARLLALEGLCLL